MGRTPAHPREANTSQTAMILLDTQVLVRVSYSPDKLSREARRVIARETSQGLGISSITLTWAATTCQPSGNFTQLCICRPTLPGMVVR